MAKANDSFDLAFTPEDFSKIDPHTGGSGFKIIPYGDYRVKIASMVGQPSKGKTPHMMAVPTFEVIHAYDKKNAHAIGEELKGYYGTKASPEFMQRRTAALAAACKIQIKGTLNSKMFEGKELDASIVWELSEGNKIDPSTGKTKPFVGHKLIGERPVGTERPKSINPEKDSAAAEKHLDAIRGGSSAAAADDSSDEPAPWEAPATETTAAEDATETDDNTVTSGFLPEDEVEASAHEYRARIKLGDEEADQYKEALLKEGIDPEGPIDVANLSDETRKEYDAKFGKKKANGLPPLGGGKAKPGTRSAARA